MGKKKLSEMSVPELQAELDSILRFMAVANGAAFVFAEKELEKVAQALDKAQGK